MSLLPLDLDNVGTAGLKTTPNTLDWHLLALFAGGLKVTYQGFDSHPDTYFMAGTEIKKLLSSNLFQINQPNNFNLPTKSFPPLRILEHCLNLQPRAQFTKTMLKNMIEESQDTIQQKIKGYFKGWMRPKVWILDNCIECRQLVP